MRTSSSVLPVLRFSFLMLAAFAASTASAAAEAAIRELKPGDFVRVEYHWRNVDKPPTASVRPYVEARDAGGRVVYSRRVAGFDRRGFVPGDAAVERWRLHFLVGGGPKPPSDAEVFFTTLPSNTVSLAARILAQGDAAEMRDTASSPPHRPKAGSFPARGRRTTR